MSPLALLRLSRHKRGMTVAARLAADYLACLRFYSRLPAPVFTFEPAPYAMLDFGQAVRMLPFAGATIGAAGALALLAADAVNLPPLACAGLALAALAAATGAFHEDGLADTADAFGGATVARKLEIMKDSRIGTFGGVALVVSLLLRASLLAEILAAQGAPLAALALVASGAASRVAALAPLMLLPPARTDGAAYAAARPLPAPFAMAVALACGFGFAPASVGLARCTVGLMLIVGAGLALAWIAQRQIKGQTGDIAGAAQQIAEIAYLAALASRS